jgi:hypothetical protein
MGMVHPVETALRADEGAAIGKNRDDMTPLQRRELRHVAGEQDPLELLVGEPLRH